MPDGRETHMEARVPDDVLLRIEVPTTLVWGRHDRFVPLGLGRDASSRLGWPLHLIDHSGHLPFVERPDTFLDALADTSVSVEASTTHEEER
ncbi:MAG: alpha/beta fold hydrolase [Actinomycetota bacterium]